MAERTNEWFRDVVPRLLAERDMSGRELARQAGMSQSYLSVVFAGDRAPSRQLMERTARALDLKADFFREYREKIVLERIQDDPEVLNRMYDSVTPRR